MMKNVTMKDCEHWCQIVGQKEANFKEVSNYDAVSKVRLKIEKNKVERKWHMSRLSILFT